MVQGTSSGAGKTTLVAALCRIFSDAGLRVSPFKSQNMSNYSYRGEGFEVSRAQAIQAIAARCKITPHINPILLKPRGNYYSMVYLLGKRFGRMHAREYYANFVRKRGLEVVSDSLRYLQQRNDLVILEGAGSPAEINLAKFDIANMTIAKRAGSPVLLVSDIDRGGSFASMVGTLELLDKRYRELVKGFIINKFRGDVELLRPAYRKIRQKTHRPILGVIPMMPLKLPEEDTLGARKATAFAWNNKKRLAELEEDIEKLSKIVKSSIDMKKIERMVS